MVLFHVTVETCPVLALKFALVTSDTSSEDLLASVSSDSYSKVSCSSLTFLVSKLPTALGLSPPTRSHGPK